MGEDKKGQWGEYEIFQNAFYMCMKMSQEPLLCMMHANNKKQTPLCIHKTKQAGHGGVHI